jgi:hypothetical protein
MDGLTGGRLRGKGDAQTARICTDLVGEWSFEGRCPVGVAEIGASGRVE